MQRLQTEPVAMASFLVMASDVVAFDAARIKAPDVFDLMMTHECWEFSERTPHRREMAVGDTFIFYLGGNHGRYIAGEATMDGPIEPITKSSAETFNRDQVPFFTLRAPVRGIVRYKAGQVTIDTIAELSFVRESTVERKYIGLLLRSGVRRLTDADVELIRSRASIVSKA